MNGTEADPFLWQLWVIPGIAALLIGGGSAFVPRLWIRRIMVAIAIAVLVPAPIFSPDGGAIVPLGMFLCSMESLGLGLIAVGITAALMLPVVWFIGWLAKGIRRDMKIENPCFKHFATVFGVAFVIGSIILSVQHLNANSAGYAGVLRIPIIAGISLAMFPRGLITFLPSSLCMAGLISGHVILLAVFVLGSAKRNRTLFILYCVLLVLNIIGCLVGHAPTNWAMG